MGQHLGGVSDSTEDAQRHLSADGELLEVQEPSLPAGMTPGFEPDKTDA